MSAPSDLQQINNELNALYEFCRKNNFSQEDVATVFRPLTAAFAEAKFRRRCVQFGLVVLLTASVCYAASTDTVSWHLSAVGRIALIELLPVWDWQHLKNRKCLVPNPNPGVEQPELQCTLCEALDAIHLAEADTNSAVLKKRYVDLHTPVIVPNALVNWTRIDLHVADLGKSVPCKLCTNIHSGFATIDRIFSKLDSFDSYLLHFQNCDFNAVKAFRAFTPRPHFVPPEISPVQYSWLLMSRNYNVSRFKPVDLQESVALFGQLQGGNRVRLLPRLNCEGVCPVVDLELLQGEALIFTDMWDLEYKPKELSENIAVILEMH